MVSFTSVIVVFAAVAVGVLYHLGHFDDKDKPSVFNLFSKHASGLVESTHAAYDKTFGDFKSLDEADNRDVQMVDDYYTIATDFYEYGWGDSFHFAHTKVGEAHMDAIYRHEHYLSEHLGLKKGDTAVDVGCGVGGPAREIASFSGADIVGITINEYQVERAQNMTSAADLADQVSYVQGDFTQMPFSDEKFDHAYAIEATCHAPQLVDVYSEVFRTLKPGGKFATYEWITCADYDENNERHNKILRELEYGNGLAKLRNEAQVLEAATAAGFVHVYSNDLAQDKDGTVPWWDELELVRTWKAGFTHAICVVTEFLGLAPVGTVDTHTTLLSAARGLIEGAELNIFTPMHLFVFQKPLVEAAPATTE